jgi:hypothetical protein
MVSMDFRYCGVLRVKQRQSIYGNDFKLELTTANSKRQPMSTKIIKASVSLVILATPAGSLFVISWFGLALLGF